MPGGGIRSARQIVLIDDRLHLDYSEKIVQVFIVWQEKSRLDLLAVGNFITIYNLYIEMYSNMYTVLITMIAWPWYSVALN